MDKPEIAQTALSEDTKLTITLISLLGISVLAAAARAILTEETRTFPAVLRGTILAAFVGLIIGSWLQDYSLSPSKQFAIVGSCGFAADYILLAVLRTCRSIAENPRIVVDVIRAKIGRP